MPRLHFDSEQQELIAIQGESLGWLPMEERAYLHVGNPEQGEPVVTVVGLPDPSMTGMNVLLLI